MLGIFFSLCSENFEKAAYIEERQGVAFCFCFQISATHGVISQRPGLLNPNPAAGSMSFAQLSASFAAGALCSAETSSVFGKSYHTAKFHETFNPCQ